MKNIKLNKLQIIVGLILSLSLIGCGTKVGTGAVNVEFTNNSTSVRTNELQNVGFRGLLNSLSLQTALQGITPTIYQKRLVVFYLVENMDAQQNNVGNVARIWTSSKCDADLTLCGINPTHSGSHVADYFDFAQGSTAVNAAFRAYQRDSRESQISAGTYRYVKMDFTGKVFSNSDTTANLKFGTSTANEVRAQNNAYNIALTTPLVLAEGETFTVNLAYSLDNRFYTSGTYANPPAEVTSDQKWTCNGTTSNIPCIVEVNFTPTVTKN